VQREIVTRTSREYYRTYAVIETIGEHLPANGCHLLQFIIYSIISNPIKSIAYDYIMCNAQFQG
jgi:hypothetical protein